MLRLGKGSVVLNQDDDNPMIGIIQGDDKVLSVGEVANYIVEWDIGQTRTEQPMALTLTAECYWIEVEEAEPVPTIDFIVAVEETTGVFNLPCFGIVISLTGDGGGSIVSDLKEDRNPAWNAVCDGLESLILAHAVAGIDVTAPAYVEGIETAENAIGNNYDDDDEPTALSPAEISKKEGLPISELRLFNEVETLKSEDGENPEYDRALLELLIHTCGGSVEERGRDVASHLGMDIDKLYPKPDPGRCEHPKEGEPWGHDSPEAKWGAKHGFGLFVGQSGDFPTSLSIQSFDCPEDAGPVILIDWNEHGKDPDAAKWLQEQADLGHRYARSLIDLLIVDGTPDVKALDLKKTWGEPTAPLVERQRLILDAALSYAFSNCDDLNLAIESEYERGFGDQLVIDEQEIAELRRRFVQIALTQD